MTIPETRSGWASAYARARVDPQDEFALVTFNHRLSCLNNSLNNRNCILQTTPFIPKAYNLL